MKLYFPEITRVYEITEGVYNGHAGEHIKPMRDLTPD